MLAKHFVWRAAKKSAWIVSYALQVNERFAIDLIAEDPVVVCTQRVVNSDSGGPLGHPKVYINLVSQKSSTITDT